jgi:DNA-binding IclR family transcriptional regulator
MASQKKQLAPSPKSGASRPYKVVRATSEDGPANSLVRLLDILSLFTPAAPAWSSEELIRSQGISRSSGYRYIKVLSDADLLAPVSDGHYILGPRILRLDHQIRQCDPLYLAAAGLLEPLVAETGCSAQVCALYSNSVLCIHQVRAPNSPPNTMGRGQSRPLFLGAASKAILAHLRPHQLKSLHTKHAKTIAGSGLGADWHAFRTALARIRKDGYVTSVGEVNPGIFGLSAPIFNSAGFILGSLGITNLATKVTRDDIPRLAKLVVAAAAQVTDRIGVMNIGTDRPPRGVG